MNEREARTAAAAFASLPSAALVVDRSGRIVLANAGAAELLGRPESDLVGTSVSELFPPPRDGEGRRTVRVRRPSGELTVLGYRMSAWVEDERPFRVITFRDVTEGERVAQERDRLLQLAAVGEALPTLLHEIRNPLAAVVATVELLIEDSPDGPARTRLLAVLAEARRISMQLDGAGAVGRPLRALQPAAADEACRDICAIMAPRAEKLGVRLRWDVPDLPPVPVEPATLRAVVLNLLSNSIQACRRGDTVRMYVRLVPGEEALEVGVVDTGPGMLPGVYARCTELFFTTKRHGSGIGLAVCRRAVEGAGGALRIDSVPGFGTSVSFTIPMTTPPVPLAESA